jgi:hypothetical protein
LGMRAVWCVGVSGWDVWGSGGLRAFPKRRKPAERAACAVRRTVEPVGLGSPALLIESLCLLPKKEKGSP